MHVAFVHREPRPLGGAEVIVRRSAELMRARGIRCSLYYDVSAGFDDGFVQSFDGTFPLVDPRAQLSGADIIYGHRLWDGASVEKLATAGRPVFRFLHDHALFCLREHKYRSFDLETCREPTGLRCLVCGPLVRKGRGVSLVSLGALTRRQNAHRRHTTLVVASGYLAHHARRHGLEEIVQVPLFVEPELERQPGLEGPHDPAQLLFVGALLRSKGVDVLLEALALTRTRFRLDIHGEGRQEGWLRARADRLCLRESVHFAGRSDREGLRRAYSRAGALVLPSRAPETFGLVGLEALAHGLPVVTSAVGGVGEWAIPGRTALTVPPNDPSALARALDRLADEPALARRMAREGRARARELDAASHVDALLAAFESSLRRRAA